MFSRSEQRWKPVGSTDRTVRPEAKIRAEACSVLKDEGPTSETKRGAATEGSEDLDLSKRRRFEQKAAKETKGLGVYGENVFVI